MAGNHKIKAKQIDITSVEKALDGSFMKKLDIDSELSETSQNPVANSAIYKAIVDKADAENISNLEKKVDTLEDTINEKASVNSPTFTGTVILPPINSESGDNLKAATVGYVNEVVKNFSNIIDGGEI